MSEDINQNREDHNKNKQSEKTRTRNAEQVEKSEIPHFFPTFRMKRSLYPIPIIITMLGAGILAYISYIFSNITGIQMEGGYFPEEEFGLLGGILDGLIFTGTAIISAFIIVIIVKKKGVNALKYIFGFSLLSIGILETIYFTQTILFLLFNSLPEFPNIQLVYELTNYLMIGVIVVFNIFMMYKYFTTESVLVKNFVVIYIGLITGALLVIFMPLWSTIIILIGISIYDLFAVLYKHGPIKQMIELISEEEKSVEQEIKMGEKEYDTSKIELGIGDLVFYSLLTSTTLFIENLYFLENIIITVLSGLAIIIGAAITIQNLKKNKILPGLPISIFLGLGTMLISWTIFAFVI